MLENYVESHPHNIIKSKSFGNQINKNNLYTVEKFHLTQQVVEQHTLSSAGGSTECGVWKLLLYCASRFNIDSLLWG